MWNHYNQSRYDILDIKIVFVYSIKNHHDYSLRVWKIKSALFFKNFTWINFHVDLFSRMPALKNFAWINFREGRITNRKRKQKKPKFYCKSFLYNVDLSTQNIYIS